MDRGDHTPLPDQLPRCKWCDDPATRWRIDQNAHWGFRPDNGQPYKEMDAYTIWYEQRVPPEAYGTCDEHFYSELDEEGNLVISAAGRHHQLAQARGQKKLPRGARLRQERESVRVELLERLGAKCENCEERRSELLRIRTHLKRPDGVQNGTQWYRWLLEHPEHLQRCWVNCLTHSTVAERATERLTVVAAYGGQCIEQPCTGSPESLWVVPGPGTRVPRYPGGRKYGSLDKYRWLIRNEFPEGWEIRCPQHIR